MLVFPLRLRASPLRLPGSLVPVLEAQNLLNVQSVLASAFRDPVNEHRDFWHGRIHPVEQAQFERH